MKVSLKLLVWVVFSWLAPSAFAGIADVFHKIVQGAVAPITVPTQTLVNAAKAAAGQAPASSILDPAKDAAHNTGQLIHQGATLAALPEQTLLQKAQELASHAGPVGSFIVDVATFTHQYEQDLAAANANAAADILQGKNLFEIVTAPLAAAIREAHNRYASEAQPLPEDVKLGLANFFSASDLDRARWAVGKIEITLPNGIDQVAKFQGEDYAVTVDNIIVFNVQPGSFQDNPYWWGHEVTHIEQYRRLGVEDFAAKYVATGGAELENPAIARGNQVRAHAIAQGQSDDSTPSGTTEAVASHPLLPAPVPGMPNSGSLSINSSTSAPTASGPADPPIIQCTFTGDPYPQFHYYGTRSGKIVVVDSTNGQWMQIGFAMPPQIPNVAWHYVIPGRVTYDVFPNGQIWLRTPTGPRPVGSAFRLSGM